MMSRVAGSSLRGYLLLALAGIAALVWSAQHFREIQRQVRAERDRLLTQQQQINEIKSLRDRPAFVASVIADVQNLTGKIGNARKAAQIEGFQITLVDPHSPIRQQNSSFVLRPVTIQLRGIQLSQIIRFLDKLTDLNEGMWASQLRLTPLRDLAQKEQTDLWNAEVVLTQTIFSPKVPDSSL